MEKIEAPKKERKFMKSVGRIAGILLQEFILGLGKKYIGKVINKVRIGKKRELLILTLASLCSFSLFAQYPNTGNKQRLGYQTTADGLIFRGRVQDTIVKPNNINNAYFLYDTINNVLYSYIKTKGQWLFNNSDTVIVQGASMPFDSVFFKTSVSPNNVDTAKMRWDSEKGTVVLGMYDQVSNELGFKNFWLVKNQTGSTITKGSLVYANGTVGASGRLTVAKFIANGTIDSKYLLGITAHDLSNGEDGYVISFGKIRQVNTDTFANGAILYPSPTVAGAWTDVEPKAPDLNMPIGFCINSSNNNGTIAIRVQSGYKLHEIQDVDTTGLNANEGLVFNGSYFVASNGKLLTPSDTTSLSSRIDTKLNTTTAASTYLPLSGGILTGALNGTTGTFTGLNVVNGSTEGILSLQGADNNTATRIQFKTNGEIRKQIVLPTATNNLEFRTSTVGGTQGGYSFYSRRSPAAEQLAFNIDLDKNILMYGTLGVTGATTLSNLAGTGDRMVVANSSGVLSTQTIPAGGGGTVTGVTATAPLYSTGGTAPNLRISNAAADSAGVVSTGTQNFLGEKTFLSNTTLAGRAIFTNTNYTANRLGGLSSANSFAVVNIGSGLSLSSGTLSGVDATASVSGIVNTTTQTFSGAKTFNSDLIVNGLRVGRGLYNIATNTAFGVNALITTTSGQNNTAIGATAGIYITSGGSNSIVGSAAGVAITTGSSNNLFGTDAGFNITTGDFNTMIGANTRPSVNNASLQIAIGHNLVGKGNSTAYIGGSLGAYNEKNVTTWETTSDIRLKKNITSYYNGLNKINQIDVRNFEYRTKDEITEVPQSAAIDKQGLQIGVIAQEYQKIFPESVTANSTGVLSVNTDNLVWHLVNSVKELSAQIEILKAEIKELKKN